MDSKHPELLLPQKCWVVLLCCWRISHLEQQSDGVVSAAVRCITVNQTFSDATVAINKIICKDSEILCLHYQAAVPAWPRCAIATTVSSTAGPTVIEAVRSGGIKKSIISYRLFFVMLDSLLRGENASNGGLPQLPRATILYRMHEQLPASASEVRMRSSNAGTSKKRSESKNRLKID